MAVLCIRSVICDCLLRCESVERGRYIQSKMSAMVCVCVVGALSEEAMAGSD